MLSLLDAFNHFITHHVGVDKIVGYKTDEGEVAFYADEDDKMNPAKILIYSVYIVPELRRQGKFKALIAGIMQNSAVQSITVMAIGNRDLDDYLEKCKWVITGGCDRLWKRPNEQL